jgi:leader peptidase (prepilin peptidase)/N-methyltransferase
VVLRGKCRSCKSRISPRYAIVELITGLLFVAAFLAPQSSWFEEHFRTAVVKSFPVDVAYDPTAISIRLCVLSFLLIGLIFTDAETKLLPDLLTKPGIVAGLAFSLWAAVEGPAGYFLQSVENWRILSLLNSVAGAVMGSAFILGIALAYEALRGVEGMGRGDVKLMGLIGAFVGVKLTLLVLLLGSLIGSLFGILLILVVWRKRLARRKARVRGEPAGKARGRAWKSATLIYRNFQIPFGVFLGIAALFAAFCGQGLIDWYMSFYR